MTLASARAGSRERRRLSRCRAPPNSHSHAELTARTGITASTPTPSIRLLPMRAPSHPGSPLRPLDRSSDGRKKGHLDPRSQSGHRLTVIPHSSTIVTIDRAYPCAGDRRPYADGAATASSVLLSAGSGSPPSLSDAEPLAGDTSCRRGSQVGGVVRAPANTDHAEIIVRMRHQAVSRDAPSSSSRVNFLCFLALQPQTGCDGCGRRLSLINWRSLLD